jgi:hypothetical protein
MPGPTPWLGLAERVNIYATMPWFAVSLLRVQGPASTRPIVTRQQARGVFLRQRQRQIAADEGMQPAEGALELT